ncbi:hypothetical protein [Nostoc parmelioides]|uniref:Uncharacterized protein n=1 Tax=Nostoc parmelioides FACHB-3921 TaxID=2692909 RepID=A0ABR8BGE4_9NOSO|nr:hypothetical protein [Nostoc parmelioides]MBD2252933.1 hypothetical protein [Nostoc parmelioides FACHB-3921]
MKILPYETLTIVTPDSLPIVLQRLRANIEPPKALRLSRKHTTYQGSISEEGFQIIRIIDYRHSFFPVIRGRFEEQSQQTLIHVQMSVDNAAMAFLGFWLLFWYSAIVPTTVTDTMPSQMAALLIGMPILMLVIFWLAFWSEVKRNHSELSDIIQG